MKFKCQVCCRSFPGGSTMDDMEAEFAQNFPGEDPADAVIVCDDCYSFIRKLHAHMQQGKEQIQ